MPRYDEHMAVLITKADGEREPYNPHKLLQSLKRSGADQSVAESIEKDIEKELYSGITTQEMYRRAFAHLRESRKDTAARYSLKRALLEFGPSGFPFEEYLARLFQAEGYSTKTDQIIKGTCVEHEIDVLMTKGDVTTYVEAKFHNTPGFKTDLKTTLYVKARLDDIAAERKAKGVPGGMNGLIVTNTKFTSQAAQYASCAGVEILSWEEPIGNTLQDRIERAQLYPVTALTTLAHREKMALLGQKVVLCQSLPHEMEALRGAGVTGHKATRVLEEVGALCVPTKGLE
jgi:hypothetical protein